MNYLDIAFAAFTLIFVVTAFFRGFVKEIFSLLNWVVALTLSYLLYPYLANLFSSYSDNKLVLDIVAQLIIFIAVFLVMVLSLAGPRDTMQEKMPKIFDRSLGVFYGLIKTLLIFGLFYSITANLYGFLLGKENDKKNEKMPSWITEAKCHSILQLSGETLDPVVKKFFVAITKNFDKMVPQQKKLNENLDE
jgi:membrane protein required for colicin V production